MDNPGRTCSEGSQDHYRGAHLRCCNGQNSWKRIMLLNKQEYSEKSVVFILIGRINVERTAQNQSDILVAYLDTIIVCLIFPF